MRIAPILIVWTLVAAPDFRLGRIELEQAADRLTAAPDGVILQHIAQREQEQQQRAFAPLIDDCRTERRQHHQQINVEPALAQIAERLLKSECAACNICRHAEQSDDHIGRFGTFRQQAEQDRRNRDNDEARLQPCLRQPERALLVGVLRIFGCLNKGCHVYTCLEDHFSQITTSSLTDVKIIYNWRWSSFDRVVTHKMSSIRWELYDNENRLNNTDFL